MPLSIVSSPTLISVSTKERFQKITPQDGFLFDIKKSSSIAHREFDKFETIEETIARLKSDVYLTGTILSIPGHEMAMFKIEEMPERIFKINTQLMDGFIIHKITKSFVVLKNQLGDESFTLYINSPKENIKAPIITQNLKNESTQYEKNDSLTLQVRGNIKTDQYLYPPENIERNSIDQNITTKISYPYPKDQPIYNTSSTVPNISIDSNLTSTESSVKPEKLFASSFSIP